jgi:hypothetical protein
MRVQEDHAEFTFINVKIKTLNNSIYDIIASPVKTIRSFQNQVEQVGLPIPRKLQFLYNPSASSIGASSSTPKRHSRTTASKKATSSSSSPTKSLHNIPTTPP